MGAEDNRGVGCFGFSRKEKTKKKKKPSSPLLMASSTTEKEPSTKPSSPPLIMTSSTTEKEPSTKPSSPPLIMTSSTTEEEPTTKPSSPPLMISSTTEKEPSTKPSSPPLTMVSSTTEKEPSTKPSSPSIAPSKTEKEPTTKPSSPSMTSSKTEKEPLTKPSSPPLTMTSSTTEKEPSSPSIAPSKTEKEPSSPSMTSSKTEKEPLARASSKKMTSFAQRWRDLSGQNHWDGLLEPLDSDLRQYLIHYGEMAQAAYDTFDTCTQSQYAGSSMYSRQDFFSKVGLVNGNAYCKYQVTKFLYATSEVKMPGAFMVFPASGEGWTKQSNWIGYVAVTTDEGTAEFGRRDIAVAWRGTIQTTEWINDFDFSLVDGSTIFRGGNSNKKGVKIHSGWLSIYTSENNSSKFNKNSARDQLLQEISRLVEMYKDDDLSITICGHSLGASLSTLSAADIVFNGYNKPKDHPDKACPVTAFPFACPRVGGSDFKNLFDGLEDLRLLRIKNVPDVVCLYPMAGYTDVGDELAMDTRKSPYLKTPGNVMIFHNMEAYLHGVAGTHGTKGDFELEVKRDISLVNKSCDGLRDQYMIPDHWRVLQNKGMAQQDDGSWKLMDHEDDDSDGDGQV